MDLEDSQNKQIYKKEETNGLINLVQDKLLKILKVI